MLLFPQRGVYYWKCAFDTDVKKENYYHHDKEQLGYISSHQNTRKKKNVLVIFILQESKNYNLFDKNYTQENVKCQFQLEKS